jgi:hypothetical protein
MSNERIPAQMAVSEAELLRMTSDLQQLHNDTMPRRGGALDDLGEAIAQELGKLRRQAHTDATRRNFLRGGLVTAGALGGGLVLAACGSDTSSSSAASSSSSSPSSTLSGDLKVAQLAASLEVLAVATYTTALQAAGQGKFGTVPPAFATFGTTAQQQHKDHGDAWNAALTKAGQTAVTTPNPKYNAVVQGALPGVKTVPDLAGLALQLETIACETYVAGASLVTDKANRAVALTIAPVEAQHIAILQFVLGKYPVADSFIKTDQAAGLDSLTA